MLKVSSSKRKAWISARLTLGNTWKSYPLVNDHIAGWKTTIFYRRYIFKWWISHCYVSLSESKFGVFSQIHQMICAGQEDANCIRVSNKSVTAWDIRMGLTLSSCIAYSYSEMSCSNISIHVQIYLPILFVIIIIAELLLLLIIITRVS